jgi:hypothetical protein
VRARVSGQTKRAVQRMARETFGGESGVVRAAVEAWVIVGPGLLVGGHIGRPNGSRPPKKVRWAKAAKGKAA